MTASSARPMPGSFPPGAAPRSPGSVVPARRRRAPIDG